MNAITECGAAMETAPKDGTKILVYYDNDADPYDLGDGKLTDYAAWAEGGSFLDGTGFCIAVWSGPHFETEDEYGSGYWMPGYWFAWHDGDCEFVVNPVLWWKLPEVSK